MTSEEISQFVNQIEYALRESMRNGVADLIEIDIASEMVELQPVDGWMQHRMGAKVTIRVPFYVARLALHATNALSLPKLFTTTFVGLQFPADYEQLK